MGKCGKKTWRTKEVAEFVLSLPKNKKAGAKNVYHCHDCDGWHLTSSDKTTDRWRTFKLKNKFTSG